MKLFLLFACSLILSPISFASQNTFAEAAISNSSRPAADKAADASRHPIELLEFSKVKAGDTVVDLMPGKGYFTRLFSRMAGERGKVIASVPEELKGAKFKPVDGAKEAVQGLPNAMVAVKPVLKSVAKGADLVWTSLNYHDLHTKNFPGLDVVAFDRAVFKALKPGGYFVVVDHAAKTGTALGETDRLHRIDPAIVKKEVEAAGFKLEEESKVLATNDDHSLPVFDPAIKGKTDQFAFRFVKPKK